jgi:spore coat protein U-like protein
VLLGAAVLVAVLLAPGNTRALCHATSITPMTFTGYDPLGAGVAATATISYTCGGNTTFGDLSLSVPRTMSSGPATLTFEVYQDPGRTAVMPNAPAIPLDVNGTSVTLWGFLPPQSAAVGSYLGTLTVSMTSDGTITRTRTFNASVTVTGTCVIQPGSVLFGSYDPGSATPRDAAGTLSITCSAGTPYTVSLGAGNNPAGPTRQMASGTSLLQYGLYSDAGRTVVWDTVSLVGGTAPSTAPIALPVYGRIPPGQLVAAGTYGDVVQATVNF